MKMLKTKPNILVLGGSVMDLVFPVRTLPNWREAVQSRSFHIYPGGKGLNQAVAAARLGADVTLVSAVGGDEFGQRIIDYLTMERVCSDLIRRAKGEYTDVTGVFVNENGDPAFVGWKSMTMRLVNQSLIKEAEEKIKSADALLITFEVSVDTIARAIHIAKQNGVLVVLNPAPPLDPLDPPPYNMLQQVDVLVPNIWEAEQILRLNSTNHDELIRLLGQLGPQFICLTTGDQGCVVSNKGHTKHHQTFSVGKPVDTSGGSDAFCAALTIGLIHKMDLESVITLANAAATLAIGKRGGSPSMPLLAEINQFLRMRGIPLQLETL